MILKVIFLIVCWVIILFIKKGRFAEFIIGLRSSDKPKVENWAALFYKSPWFFVTFNTPTMGQYFKKTALCKRMYSIARFTGGIVVHAINLCKRIMPFLMPRISIMCTCSRVWGITPSLAAMTRSAKSMPLAPETMVFTKSRCPGTSTMPTMSPFSSGRCANPRLMVIPRRFSSLWVSQSMPVSAFTRAVLPWSMCPAVPMIRCFIFYLRQFALQESVVPSAAPVGELPEQISHNLFRVFSYLQ